MVRRAPITPDNPYGVNGGPPPGSQGRSNTQQRKPVAPTRNRPHPVPGTPYFYKEKTQGGRGYTKSSPGLDQKVPGAKTQGFTNYSDRNGANTGRRGSSLPQQQRGRRVFQDGSPATTPISNRRNPQSQAIQNLQKKYGSRKAV